MSAGFLLVFSSTSASNCANGFNCCAATISDPAGKSLMKAIASLPLPCAIRALTNPSVAPELLGWLSKTINYSLTLGAAIHMIDLVMWFLDSRPISVTTFGNKEIT